MKQRQTALFPKYTLDSLRITYKPTFMLHLQLLPSGKSAPRSEQETAAFIFTIRSLKFYLAVSVALSNSIHYEIGVNIIEIVK